jgi:hypothetical protein
MIKECIKCKQIKKIFEFCKNKQLVSGINNTCKICANEKSKLWRENNKEKAKENNKNYRKTNQEKLKTLSKNWRHRNLDKSKEYSRKSKMKLKFGITIEQYKIMEDIQNKKCKICAKEETALNKFKEIKNLAVDHCHATGKIRGLLCQNCNTGLGGFKDSIENLKTAIKYLKKES